MNPISSDLVIYGSTPAAITAAIEASRLGKSTLIVCPESRIGGMTTGGLGQTDRGHEANEAAFGGLAIQFYRDIYTYYQDDAHWIYESRSDYLPDGQCAKTLGSNTMWTFEPSAALAVLLAWEKKHNLTILRNEYLDRTPGGVIKEGNRIIAFKTLSGKTIQGKMFVDATYEGDLMAAAGVRYFVGREGNAKYGEKINGIRREGALGHNFLAGVSAYRIAGDPTSGLLPYVEPDCPEPDGSGDSRLQAYCFRMCLTNDPKIRIPFIKPDHYDPINYELLIRNLNQIEAEKLAQRPFPDWFGTPWINSRMPNHKTDTNNCRGFSTDFIGQNYRWPEASYAEREVIRKAHLDYQMGLMWTLANDPRVPEGIREVVSQWGTCQDEFTDGLGHGWQSQLYVREARRMVGDYIMTEANCCHETVAPRPIGVGVYTMDSHNVRRYVDDQGNVRNEGDVQVWLPKGPYTIEYGALLPKEAECQNLLVPVCLSASHMAFGSIRMEPVFFALGQAAGAAAALAIDAQCALQTLDYAVLRKTLLAEGHVLEVPAQLVH